MPTTVRNMRTDEMGPNSRYVGRAVRRLGLPASPWANPFRIGPDGTREEVVAKYDAYLDTRPDLLARLDELADRELFCWCRPREGFRGRLMCHAQILAGRADGVPPEQVP